MYGNAKDYVSVRHPLNDWHKRDGFTIEDVQASVYRAWHRATEPEQKSILYRQVIRNWLLYEMRK